MLIFKFVDAGFRNAPKKCISIKTCKGAKRKIWHKPIKLALFDLL
jgi:hypothetical protein